MTLRHKVSLIAACAWLSFGSCGGCSKDLAELRERTGGVDRDFSAERGAWSAAEQGATFREGDGLRTGADGLALLRVGRRGRMRVEANSAIRFYSSQPAGDQPSLGVEVERGGATIETPDEDLTLETRKGVAVVERGGKLRVESDEKGQRYNVLFGKARFEGSDGQSETLERGDAIVVGIGMAVLHGVGQSAQLRELEAPALPSPASEAEAAAPEDDPSAADLTVRGKVRSRANDKDDWAALAEGRQRVGGGAELDVGEGSSVDIERDGQRATLSRGRYRVGQSGEALVHASAGDLSVEAKATDVIVRVPGGTIVAKGGEDGSSARLSVADGKTDVDVVRGQVVTTGDLGSHEIGAGQMKSLVIADNSGAPDAIAELRDSALLYADMVVPSGQSFWVYDPAPPTAIGFSTEFCKAGAEVRIGDQVRGRSIGDVAQVNLPVSPGTYTYTVRCLHDGSVRTKADKIGRVRVLRSAGTRRLPRKPSKNDVDMDGRLYTVMYQNLKPIVLVRWPNAPKASGYALQVRSPRGRNKTFRSSKPVFTLKSGALGDGTHKLFFETKAGGKLQRSKVTSVEVLFDNAAPTGSLELPPAEGVVAGATATVKGVAVSGSTVTVDGKRLPMDSGHRFKGEVPVRSGQRALIVRFQHPRHGLRYYIRRTRR